MLTRTNWSRSSFSRPKVHAKLIPIGHTMLSGNNYGESGYVFQSGYRTRSIHPGVAAGIIEPTSCESVVAKVGVLNCVLVIRIVVASVQPNGVERRKLKWS